MSVRTLYEAVSHETSQDAHRSVDFSGPPGRMGNRVRFVANRTLAERGNQATPPLPVTSLESALANSHAR